MKLSLQFGALAPRLAKQLKTSGVTARADDVRAWQKDADATARLAVRGLLTETGAHGVRQKMMKRIIAALAREQEEGK